MKVLTMQHITFFSFEVTYIFKTYTLLSKRVKHIFLLSSNGQMRKVHLKYYNFDCGRKRLPCRATMAKSLFAFYFLRKGFC